MSLVTWLRVTTIGAVFAIGVPAVAAHATTDASDTCTWTASALPLPTGVVSADVSGTDGGTTFAGTAWTVPGGRNGQGIIWRNGTPQLLGYAYHQLPTTLVGVNTAGDAVGFVYKNPFDVPVLYHNGAYENLTAPFASTPELTADGIDTAGDVVGTAIEHDGTNAVVIWPVGQPTNPRALPLPAGAAVELASIEDDGYVVASSGVGSYVWAPNGTMTMITPVQQGDIVNAADIRGHLIVGISGSTVAEWTITGQVLRTLPGAQAGVVRINANDQVLAGYQAPAANSPDAVWQTGAFDGVLNAPTSAQSEAPADITDDGLVAGSYTTDAGVHVPAEWTCS